MNSVPSALAFLPMVFAGRVNRRQLIAGSSCKASHGRATPVPHLQYFNSLGSSCVPPRSLGMASGREKLSWSRVCVPGAGYRPGHFGGVMRLIPLWQTIGWAQRYKPPTQAARGRPRIKLDLAHGSVHLQTYA